MNDGFAIGLRKLGCMVVLAALLVLLTAPPVRGQTSAREEGLIVQETTQDILEDLFEQVVGHKSGGYYTWVDDDGEFITLTAITPVVGDSYMNEANRLYEVVSVDDDRTVHASYKETMRLPQVFAALPVQDESRQAGIVVGGAAAAASSGSNNVIGIYHSHNAESYVQSSGEEFIEPHGEIVDVGAALAEALEAKGFTVVHSEASHLPHDGGAYQRSRGTVRELLEEDAVALLDVHRDAIPAEHYVTDVDGDEMTKVRLVVGRQNPNRDANLELAHRIKAIADEQYPGLVKGIFHAHGNYNQDVGPRTVLLEFGTHETSVEDAVKSARLFAEVYPAAAGLTDASSEAAGQQIGGAGLRSALWFAVLAGAGLFGYLWINEGSPQGAWQRIRGFVQREAGRIKPGSGGDGEGP